MKVGDLIRVKDLSHIAPIWRGQTGVIKKLLGETAFGMNFEVEVQGIELLLFDFEIEEMN